MQVPAFDLTRQNAHIGDRVISVLREVVSSGKFILGENVQSLERELERYLSVAHALGVANGSDALYLALLALGIGPGDEVIVPSFTFFATGGAVQRVGATPVFADVCWDTFCVDPISVRSVLTNRTRCIIAVHLFGHPADIGALTTIASDFGIHLIEDCAQSIGATYQGQMTGTFGQIGCFSFFPTKNLGAMGDGGAVTTADDELAAYLTMARVHGAHTKYYHEVTGINSRLDELQAAVLREKLNHLHTWTEQRRHIAAVYDRGLANLPLQLPVQVGNCRHVYHQYCIKTPDRDGLQEFLRAHDIGSAVYYPRPLHLQPVFRSVSLTTTLSVSERLSSHVLALPMFPELSAPEVAYVCDTIRSYFSR